LDFPRPFAKNGRWLEEPIAQKDGTLFVIGNTCYLKYYTMKDGQRVSNTVRLCSNSDVYDWSSKAKRGSKKRKWSYSRPVIELQRETMAKIKAEQAALTSPSDDVRILDFWDRVYVPYLEAIGPLTGEQRRAPSTVRGFKQIWKHSKRISGTQH
jgi:hypothetical protein